MQKKSKNRVGTSETGEIGLKNFHPESKNSALPMQPTRFQSHNFNFNTAWRIAGGQQYTRIKDQTSIANMFIQSSNHAGIVITQDLLT